MLGRAELHCLLRDCPDIHRFPTVHMVNVGKCVNIRII